VSRLLDLLEALNASDAEGLSRSAVQVVLVELIKADATALIRAERRERTDTRAVQRNGHRPRILLTTTGDLELVIPKMRAGSFLPYSPDATDATASPGAMATA